MMYTLLEFGFFMHSHGEQVFPKERFWFATSVFKSNCQKEPGYQRGHSLGAGRGLRKERDSSCQTNIGRKA